MAEEIKTDVRSAIVKAVAEAADEVDPKEFEAADSLDSAADEIEAEAGGVVSEEAGDDEDAPETAEADEDEDEDEPEEEPEDLSPELIESLTDEDREAIKANPAMAKLQKSLLRAYTQKTMKLAAYNRIIKGLQDSPDETLAMLAAGRGLTITKPAASEEPAVDKARAAAKAEVVRLFGEEHADAVLGLIEKVADIKTESAVAPLKQAAANLIQRQAAAEVVTATSAFTRAHRQEITDDVERGMVALGQELLQKGMGPGPETNREAYMEMLLEVTLARQGKSKTSARLAERTRRNTEEAEPRHGVGGPAAGEPKSQGGGGQEPENAPRGAAGGGEGGGGRVGGEKVGGGGLTRWRDVRPLPPLAPPCVVW